MPNNATNRFIEAHRNDDVRKLAFQFRSQENPEVDIHFALTQIENRRLAAAKIPSWERHDGLIFPSRLALEQCSSEDTARYKAALLSGDTFADLTGGFGVDFAFIAPNFKKSFYVERQKDLCEMARHNWNVLGLITASVENADSVEYLKRMSPVDVIFIDPARRSALGKKTVAIENAEPNLLEIQDLLLEKASTVLIKLSPMLDIAQSLDKLKHVAEVHVVGVNNECKELLFLLKRQQTHEPQIHCVNPDKDEKISFRYPEEKACSIGYASGIAAYLYEPHVTLLKAGFFKSLAQIYRVQKLHPHSHLYTSQELVENFPGRIFKVDSYSSLNKKDLKNFLLNITKANLTVRNFPTGVDELEKKLRITAGGDVFLFATTLADGKRVLVKCYKIYCTV
ncbi:MAG: class I SAM-dependent methyltransferase [Dysgonamonadaceae bacterium]|jgi:16S rRNA G966 N2-methylase RsmD|nr:class I SAM-dependent methyltransferase [Dysgonamonadaceae bacterium]